MYLFDTDTLSHLVRRRPSESLVERVRSVPVRHRFAASTSAAELLFGALVLGDGGRALLERIERDLLADIDILPFDEAAARLFARAKADLHRRGAPIGDADLQIASIGLAHGFTVVTANTRHLQRVQGLAVENWLG